MNEKSPYYPDVPCWKAPLRPCDPAPKPGCNCDVCRALRPSDARRLVPVVISRNPFHGELRPAND